MALPGNVTPITVTGLNLPMIDGQTQDGYAVIDPGTIITDATGQAILAGAATTQIRASVMIPVELPPTDSATLNPPPGQWAYTITLRLGSQVITSTFALPRTLGPTVDLSALINITPPPPVTAFAATNNWTGTQVFEGDPGLRMPAGAISGYVLTTDAAGNSTWGAFAGGTGTGIADLDGGSAATGAFPVGALDGGTA